MDNCLEDSALTTAILEELGERFHQCIQAVEELQIKRDALIQEVLLLREPVFQELQGLHEELLLAHRMKARAALECDYLREEIKLVKRTLFKTTREYIGCQYTLESQRHDVAQFAISREELESEANALSLELLELQDICQKQKDQLQHRLQNSQNVRQSWCLSDCRRLSLEFKSFLDGNQQSLEDYYEPKLVALLGRREASNRALRWTQDEVKVLKDKLKPLKEETERLKLQKATLEKQFQSMERRQKEEALLHKEAAEELDERIGHLKTRVELQKRKNEEIEKLKQGLSQELSVYKNYLEEYGQVFEDKHGEAPTVSPTGKRSQK
ncbi:syncoilin [Latimeria chalumnae]|uniref:Syncoilin, intermediate filament protein n=1 Tax=Latimeria chalumnae TaxID=7897 RepID=H3B8H3_LATCH|nr:PREDICTED: syncoilin [Latimeria chalumnae]|eukprot:XP_005995643.1 PREDICTED: syncoilin [Latimeria chalumnae]